MVPTILIAATDREGAIGRHGQLPWNVPDELKHFKLLTLNHCVLMGRTTFESLHKPLANRHNLVLSSNPEWSAEGATRVNSIEEAKLISFSEYPEKPLFIAGGSKVYHSAIDMATAAVITRIDLTVYDPDVWFPSFGKEWILLNSELRTDDLTEQDFKIERWARCA